MMGTQFPRSSRPQAGHTWRTWVFFWALEVEETWWYCSQMVQQDSDFTNERNPESFSFLPCLWYLQLVLHRYDHTVSYVYIMANPVPLSWNHQGALKTLRCMVQQCPSCHWPWRKLNQAESDMFPQRPHSPQKSDTSTSSQAFNRMPPLWLLHKYEHLNCWQLRW